MFRISRRARLVLRALLLAPVIIAARLLSPFLLVRFGMIPSGGMGHFAANPEVFLCEQDAGINRPSRRHVDLFFLEGLVCNRYLAWMWARVLRILPFSLEPIEQLLRRVPGGTAHIVPMVHSDRDVFSLVPKTPPHLHLTADEEEAGRAALARMGLPEGAEFICFHARDDAYLKSVEGYYSGLDIDLSYHSHRHSTIDKFLPAVQHLTRRGCYAIRMGAVVSAPLQVSDPLVLDYGGNGSRTDFLDIYLAAKCRFFLSSAAGIDALPRLFRRPIMWVNYLPFEYIHVADPRTVWIPKKHWLRREKRFMRFREILESGAGRFIRKSDFDRLEIELIENTPEEIDAAVIEMDDRLSGRWQSSREAEDLQQRFWALFKPSDINGNEFRAHLGAQFLYDHRDLLD